EPFGGANTGVGGVIRDILGVSARPIACTDVLCFGPPSMPADQLGQGVLHPKRIADGVTAGIEDYGNKMGIPTVNGAIVYDPGYTANPLVYCGCLGILPSGSHRTDPRAGDLVVCIGGRTGRDGLRGATFSSMEMGVETSDIASTSVQVGHPIHEKQALEVLCEARDANLYTAVTDCGAGGLSSSIGEMAAELGAVVNLENAELKYAGLGPWEIWLSEAQERMVFAVDPSNWQEFKALCERHTVPCMALGHFTGEGRLVVKHHGTVVGDLDVHFLHDGIPQRTMQAQWTASIQEPINSRCPMDLTEDLLAILALPDVRSKEDVIRTYDHEVQGGTVTRPLVGPLADGPGDACVLIPLDVQEHRDRQGASSAPIQGVALSVGQCPQVGKIDPEVMAWFAVDEAVRNAVAVGADPTHLALLDNFCWGNPNLPDRLGGLTLAARGCYHAALAYEAPFISGKDSLNNEYRDAQGEKHAIPGTLLISAVAKVNDVTRTAESAFTGPGQTIIVVGRSQSGLGASAYAQVRGLRGGVLPSPTKDPLETMKAVHRVISSGLCRSCHDCSEGGIAAALAEMAIGARCGAEVDLSQAPGATDIERADSLVFGEGPTRFVMAVAPDELPAVMDALSEVDAAVVGSTTTTTQLIISTGADKPRIEASVDELVAAFKGHLDA
ncbi:MAG TPA: phosphoribosylformylglycinamidine synthase, partial [Myxococcales bacterium]|nr:phosphoribosylformylglycinamidine synthase [Myxococcales bacterium]